MFLISEEIQKKTIKVIVRELSKSTLLKVKFWYTYQIIIGLDDFGTDYFSSDSSIDHSLRIWKWLMTFMWSTYENQNEDQKIIAELIIDTEKLLMTIDFSENIENLNSIWSGTDLPLIWSIFQMSFDHITAVHILDNDKSYVPRFWCKSESKEKNLTNYLVEKKTIIIVLYPRIRMVWWMEFVLLTRKKTDTMMTWNSIRSSWNTSILEDARS